MSERTWWSVQATNPGHPIIAIDPGLMTGVAVLRPDGTVQAGEDTWQRASEIIETCIKTWHPLVVCESFVITEQTAKHTAAPWSLEGIGVARYLAAREGVEFALQLPVEAKKFSTNARLKAQGWYITTPGGHTNDGLRHLYLNLVHQRRLIPPRGVI